MKNIKFIIFVIICSLTMNLLLLLPQSAKAYSPIIASCSNGVLEEENYFSVGGRAISQLFEVRLDHYYLDAVSVRLKSALGSDSAVVSVIKRDGPTIATSAVQPVTTSESWIYFDLPNVPIPRGVYLLDVLGTSPEIVVWKWGPGTCIDDSYMIIDGERHQEYDMAFAIYAYDSSLNNEPADDSQQGDQSNQNSSVSDNSDQAISNTSELPPGSNNIVPNKSSSTSGTTTPTSSKPKENDAGLNLGFLAPLLIGGFIFLGIILFVLWMILINRKKKDEDKTHGKLKEGEKKEDKEEEKENENNNNKESK